MAATLRIVAQVCFALLPNTIINGFNTYVLVLFSAGGGVVVLGGGGVDGALASLRVLAGVAAVGAGLQGVGEC